MHKTCCFMSCDINDITNPFIYDLYITTSFHPSLSLSFGTCFRLGFLPTPVFSHFIFMVHGKNIISCLDVDCGMGRTSPSPRPNRRGPSLAQPTSPNGTAFFEIVLRCFVWLASVKKGSEEPLRW